MNALSSSAYLNEAARRADADTEMRVFSSTKAIHLRINRQAIASISTRVIAQDQMARTIAKRYNTQPALLAAAERALQFIALSCEGEPAQSIINALKEAIAQ